MGEINQVLGGHGAGRELAGFTFFRPNLRELAKFEAWLEELARQEVLKWKEHLEPNMFAAQVQATANSIARGIYSWDTDPNSSCGSRLETPDGKCRLLWIVAGRKRAVKLEDVEQAYYDLKPEFDELLKWMLDSSPNSPAPTAPPGQTTSGEPSLV